MIYHREGATALVGLPGFVVGVQVDVGGEWWRHVETTSALVGCSSCGTRAVAHGRRRVKGRDLAIAGRPVVSVRSKRIWRCPDCDTRTWTETSDTIRPRVALTERARAEKCRRVGKDEDSVAGGGPVLRGGLATRR